MASLSEHIAEIQAAIKAAEKDGYEFGIDPDFGDLDIYQGNGYLGTVVGDLKVV